MSDTTDRIKQEINELDDNDVTDILDECQNILDAREADRR